MTASALLFRRLTACLVGALLLSGPFTLAQQQNLLTNPGFEGGFSAFSGQQPRSVANGWEPWHIPREDDMPSFQNAQPLYIAASQAGSEGITPRIRTGNDAQVFWTRFATFEGGLYQQVTGLTPGAELRFSIYGRVWSSTFGDPELSEDPGDVSLRVGIDPTGGTDPTAASVVYAEPAIFYDTYRQYAIIDEAESSTVTVFVRVSVGLPVQNTEIFLDDAELALTSDPSDPDPTATDDQATEIAEGPTPTQEGTPFPTATTTPSVTPTERPTTTPTRTPSITTTPITPTATPTDKPEETPEETDTTNPTLVPTATPIGQTATPDDTETDSSDESVQPTAQPEAPLSETFPGTIVHTVRRGDTVAGLAQRYGSTTEAIITANDLDASALIFAGQGLVVPVRLVPATATPTQTPVVIVVTATPVPGQPTQSVSGDEGIVTDGGGGQLQTYLVRPGDTLSGIARAFNTTVGALVQLNGIANPNRVFAGQTLNIPVAGTAPVTDASSATTSATPTPTPQPTSYVVQPGDNLYVLSVRFGVSMRALAEANNIRNYNLLFVGQRLTIPSS